LLGFVGIVTDLSILYIRFASLRRAVDSAAVAAAGQFSRTVSDQENKERTQFAARQFLEFHGIDAENIVVDTCASVPTYEDDAARAANYNQPDFSGLTDADFETDWGLLNEYPDYIDGPSATWTEEEQEVLQYRANLHNDVCRQESDGTLSGRKLVRVQASIAVPAPILSTVTGFLIQDNLDERATDIVLTASAVSETASLDVVIVMDVSESMLFDTRYEDYDHWLFTRRGELATPQRIMRYIPPRLSLMYQEYLNEHTGTPERDDGGGWFGATSEFIEGFLAEYLIGWYDQNAVDESQPAPFPPYNHIPRSVREADPDALPDDPYSDPLPYLVDEDGDASTTESEIDLSYARYFNIDPLTPVLLDPGNPDIISPSMASVGSEGEFRVRELRPECRVRIHPASVIFSVSDENPRNDGSTNNPEDTLQEEYIALTGGDANSPWRDTPEGNPASLQLFQPNYDFYGCCNDPTAGSTIVTEGEFLGDIVVCDGDDPTCFGSGDFDFQDLVCQPFKQARDASLRFLYNIDFLAGDRVGFVTFDRGAFAIDPDAAGPKPVMIETREEAIRILTRSVGVRAEPNFLYYDATATTDFKWDGYSSGTEVVDGQVRPILLELEQITPRPTINFSAVGALTRPYL
ncbi:MAG: hypothetical protein AAF653_17635, partial [Chloroflexota bacterium]